VALHVPHSTYRLFYDCCILCFIICVVEINIIIIIKPQCSNFQKSKTAAEADHHINGQYLVPQSVFLVISIIGSHQSRMD
jgi:hypothetical protein